jgi:phosphoglycolate phosphatase-like HAD superfamily hydrolase
MCLRHPRTPARWGTIPASSASLTFRGQRHRNKTLVVGDTPYDILAARRAALPVAAVLLTKAEFLFDDVEEL